MRKCKCHESASIYPTEKQRDQRLKSWIVAVDGSRREVDGSRVFNREWGTAEPWYPPQAVSAKVLFWLSCVASATIVISLTLAAFALAGWL